jgi:HK97 family phage major capsid protein
MTTKELREKRVALAEEANQILKKAHDDKRDVLKAEEEQEWQRRHDEIDSLGRHVVMLEKQEELARSFEVAQERKVEPMRPGASNGDERSSTRAMTSLRQGQEDLTDALRGWFIAGSDQEPTERHIEAAKRVGLDFRNRTLHMRLAPKPPRNMQDVRDWDLRAQSTLTGAAGLFTVPDEMMRSLEKALLFFGGMRQASTILRTDTGADLPIPTVNDTNQVGVILDQNTAVANQDVTFAQLVLKAFKYSSKQVLVSVEMMQDSSINVAEVLGDLLGERIGRITNTHFTVGAGTTLPWGIVTRATSGLAPVGSVAGGILYTHLVDMEASVDIAYRRQGASWMMSDVMLSRIKKLVDTAGRPIWLPALNGIAGAFPDTILGYPVIINNDVVSTQTTGSRTILFGALQKYLIRDVRDITLLRLDERYAEFHQVAFLAFSRHDGDLLNAGTNPVKFFAFTT